MIANNTIVDGNFKTAHLGSNNIINMSSSVRNNIIYGSNSIVPSNVGVIFSNNNWRVTPSMAVSSTDVFRNPLLARTGVARKGVLSGGYFKILSGSPVINKAKDLSSVPNYFFNIIRGSSPDSGGHEFP